MADDELVRRDEAKAALAARRELGDEYEDALVESFAQRLEERLAQRHTAAPARDRGPSLVLAFVSIGCGIPITALALDSGLAALVVVWAGIVAINAVVARSR